jgi:hypothetical protein
MIFLQLNDLCNQIFSIVMTIDKMNEKKSKGETGRQKKKKDGGAKKRKGKRIKTRVPPKPD